MSIRHIFGVPYKQYATGRFKSQPVYGLPPPIAWLSGPSFAHRALVPQQGDTMEPLGKLIVVDDYAPNANGMRDLLSVAGYNVRVANNGEDALRLVDRGPTRSRCWSMW